ncbi:MAG: hypothetical protein AAB685_00535 [Patescibacteria group bacterium]
MSFVERAVEFSKRLDYVLIAVGSGIYLLFNKAIGVALIIGSVITLIPINQLSPHSEHKATT